MVTTQKLSLHQNQQQDSWKVGIIATFKYRDTSRFSGSDLLHMIFRLKQNVILSLQIPDTKTRCSEYEKVSIIPVL